MKESTDQEIIWRVIAGEQKAYAELIDRHKEKAMTLAVRMLKNKHDAEEALQDAFVRAFKALPAFEWKSSFSTWFYRIVFNVCSSTLSKRKSGTFISIDDENEEYRTNEISSEISEPDIEFEHNELSAIIKKEIESMEEKYSVILTLFFLQEMSYEEIMAVTGLPVGTVKNRLFRARTLLRSALLRHYPEEKILENI
jgi:RNA polymerase sigma-70 factor (ECF subfamily)